MWGGTDGDSYTLNLSNCPVGEPKVFEMKIGDTIEIPVDSGCYVQINGKIYNDFHGKAFILTQEIADTAVDSVIPIDRCDCEE